MKKLKYLLKPEGVRDLLPELAAARRKVEDSLNQIFQQWGYVEIVTPGLEYSNLFSEGLKADYDDKMYRFLDSRGRTIVLRPDWTLPLARVVSSQMACATMPLRLAYFGNVYRFTSPRLGQQREFFQAGVEFIGAPSPMGDAEIIALAIAALKKTGVKNNLKICIGHTSFLKDVLDTLPLTSSPRDQINEYFNEKNFVSLKEFIDSLDISDKQKKTLLSITRFKGGAEVLDKAGDALPGDVSRRSLSELKTLHDQLVMYNLEDYIIFDLALMRGLKYYTGMVFEGYSSYLGFPLCGGGRYDQLLGHFGCPHPAIGFALSVDNLLIVLNKLNLIGFPRADVLVAFHPRRQHEALRKVQELRSNGLKAILDVNGLLMNEAQEYAVKKRIARLIYVGEDKTEERVFNLADTNFLPEIKETWPGLHS